MDERRVTLSGRPPEPGTEGTGAPGPINPRSGQHTDYWVLSEEERAKGFVEPVRRSYKHVGIPGPKYPLRDLTEQEKESFGERYVKYEVYPRNPPDPELSPSALGHLWSQEDLDKIGKGCGSVTSMGMSIAETYARQPEFYGSTFCCKCGVHLPVGKDGEFVWDGTAQRVGTRRKEWVPTVTATPPVAASFACSICQKPIEGLTSWTGKLGEGPVHESCEPSGWKPYVPEPLKDVSEMLSNYSESKNKLSRATLILEYEGTGIPPTTLVLKAEEDTALLFQLDLRNGVSAERTQKPDERAIRPTGESDFKLEIFKRKI